MFNLWSTFIHHYVRPCVHINRKYFFLFRCFASLSLSLCVCLSIFLFHSTFCLSHTSSHQLFHFICTFRFCSRSISLSRQSFSKKQQLNQYCYVYALFLLISAHFYPVYINCTITLIPRR